MNLPKQKHRQQGASLIEVMVALLIFTVGLLGLAALQLTALQSTSDSGQRSQSVWLMQDLIERMRANPAGTVTQYAAPPNCAALPSKMCADHYNPSSAAKVAASNCNGLEMATFDTWEAQCSYVDIATFNTIDARFNSRDFIIPPEAGTLLNADVNDNGIDLDLSLNWLSKSSQTTIKDGSTSELRIER